MNMIEAVGTCFRKYFRFSGRARRAEYWWWFLFTILGSIVMTILDVGLFGTDMEDTGPADAIFTLATFIPTLAVGWRRLHDTGRSGWWLGGYILAIFFGLLLIVGMAAFGAGGDITGMLYGLGFFALFFVIGILAYVVVLIVFLCQPGQTGDNKYGPDPIDGFAYDDVFG